MNKRFLSVLVFGLVVSAVASFVLYRLIAARIVATSKTATTPVVVAARTLDLGTLIKDSDVKLVDWSGPVPAGAISKPEDVIGRGVMSSIYQGEPTIESRLAIKGAGAGLAATIPSGMRAVAISVNEVVGVAGFVVPGMRVDVLVSGNPPGAAAAATGTQTRTVLQNMQVLSAGQNIQKDAEGKPVLVQVVNLLVTPDQAETLSLASHEARIQLVLRNPLDNQIAKTSGTAFATLFGGEVKPAAVHVAQARRPDPVPVKPAVETKPEVKIAPPIIVEVLHGSSKAETKFRPEGEARQ
jgi:pilus assembly protein CpaB